MGESFLRAIKNSKLEESGFCYTLSLISGKYKMVVLYTLSTFDVVRFNELKRIINVIPYKTLSATLKELEADGLIIRTEYPQIPPKVEYTLSERGKSLIPILDEMCAWGEINRIPESRSMAYLRFKVYNLGRLSYYMGFLRKLQELTFLCNTYLKVRNSLTLK